MNAYHNNILYLFLLLFSIAVFADDAEPQGFQPTEPLRASWVFSGIIRNESGEQYGYFFQIKRHDDQFQALTALIDEQTKKVVLYEEDSAIIPDPAGNSWQIGHAFFSFNPINDSWVFGLKRKDKTGFNFKVDMLRSFANEPVIQVLRPDIKLIVSQTNRVNGHLHIGEETKEQFVTANSAWFRQVWLTEKQEHSHTFSGILCQFDDGSGFYSVNLKEDDAQDGAVAGFCDKEGQSKRMSQFVDLQEDKEQQSLWHIRIASPRMHLTLSDEIPEKHIRAGFFSQDNQSGFCLLNDATLGENIA